MPVLIVGERDGAEAISDPLHTRRLFGDPALLGRPNLNAPPERAGLRERRRRDGRSPVRHRRDLPLRRVFRPRGDTQRLAPVVALQPEPRRGHLRRPLDHRLRRRAGRSRLCRGELRAHSRRAGAHPPGRRRPGSARRNHSKALPELRAAAAVHGPLALVRFDSHPDTWDFHFGENHDHGTPFRRAVEQPFLDRPARSVQVGMRGSLYDAGDRDDTREMGFDLVPTDEVRELGIYRR